uniref:DEAD-box helicase 28 n=1 Tax=Chelydra serpentina TaxID=8475 RepID=A0A8C3S3K8_CHESE
MEKGAYGVEEGEPRGHRAGCGGRGAWGGKGTPGPAGRRRGPWGRRKGEQGSYEDGGGRRPGGEGHRSPAELSLAGGTSLALALYCNNHPPSLHRLPLRMRLGSRHSYSTSSGGPTAVQRRAIPALLRGGNALCAAETGSGKTLAYLLPLFQKLLSRPSLGPAWPPSPRSLVLLPSRELADVKNQLRSDPDADLLVSTPGALCKALRKRMVRLERLCCLVLDEADTLLDPTFLDLVEEVLMQAPIAQSPKELADQWDTKTQLVVVGATFPQGLGQLLSKVTNLGRFTTLTSQNLHHLLPHVQQKFIRIKGSDKASELLQLIKDQGPASGAVLVFCNNASTVNWLGYILDDHKIKHLRLQGQMPAAMRAGIFTTFQKGQRDVLICTDLASRGLDTSHVELVVNYDFPSTLQDYLHRVGRVGRVGSKVPGTVVSFVTHRWDVDLVRKIETAARRRTSLPGMESLGGWRAMAAGQAPGSEGSGNTRWLRPALRGLLAQEVCCRYWPEGLLQLFFAKLGICPICSCPNIPLRPCGVRANRTHAQVYQKCHDVQNRA